MKVLKAILVFALAAALCVWSGAEGVLPVGEPVQDFLIGIVGTVGLAIAAVFRTLGIVLVPMLGILRVLAVPLLLGGFVYVAFRAGRRA